MRRAPAPVTVRLPPSRPPRSWHLPQLRQALRARSRFAPNPQFLVWSTDHPVVAPNAFILARRGREEAIGERAADNADDLARRLTGRLAARCAGWRLATEVDDA